jgi:hypothetical protein
MARSKALKCAIALLLLLSQLASATANAPRLETIEGEPTSATPGSC